MTDAPEARGKAVARERIEFALVLLLCTVAVVAYAVMYSPWAQDSVVSPREYFAAMPVLFATVFGALSLGSAVAVRWWMRAVDRDPRLVWSYPIGIAGLYAACTAIAGHGNLRDMAALAVYLVVPVAFARVHRLWADWVMILAAALPILLKWVYLPNLPATGEHGQIQVHTLFAAAAGLWAIIVVRRLPDFEFRLTFDVADLKLGLLLCCLFSVVAFPLSMATGVGNWNRRFTLHEDFSASPWMVYALLPVGMYFGVALIEETLYRGLFQNLVGKALRSPIAGLVIASLVFGITHFKPPRGATPARLFWWGEYAFFAGLAGFVYGYAYLKTRRIMPGAVAHALVNSLWMILYNPVLFRR